MFNPKDFYDNEYNVSELPTSLTLIWLGILVQNGAFLRTTLKVLTLEL